MKTIVRNAGLIPIGALAALLALGSIAGAQPSPAKKAEAKARYEAGSRKFDVAKYDEAAIEFEAAYELVGDPVILYNIAQSYRLAQKHERALFFYKTYLRKVADPGNKAEVESRIADLTKVLAEQKRATEAPPTGTLKPSDHEHTAQIDNNPKVAIVKPVERPVVKPIEKPPIVRPIEKPPVIENPPIENPPVEKPPIIVQNPPPRRAPQRSPLMKYLGFGLAGLAVAALATGAAMNVLAHNNAKDIENAATGTTAQMWTPALQGQLGNIDTYNNVAIAMYVVGGLAAAGAGVCLYLGLKPEPSSRAQIVPLFDTKGAGLAVLGRF